MNEVRIDIASNPDLAGLFSYKNPGDACEFTVSGRVKDVDQKQVTIAIKKISVDDAEEKSEPNSETPVAIVMA